MYTPYAIGTKQPWGILNTGVCQVNFRKPLGWFGGVLGDWTEASFFIVAEELVGYLLFDPGAILRARAVLLLVTFLPGGHPMSSLWLGDEVAILVCIYMLSWQIRL